MSFFETIGISKWGAVIIIVALSASLSYCIPELNRVDRAHQSKMYEMCVEAWKLDPKTVRCS